MSEPVIVVLCGGISPEREVSLGSGKAAAEALRKSFSQVVVCDVTARAVPRGIEAATTVVFTTLHGIFGEDGGMQELLEQRNVSYCGCDSCSSRLCFDKQRTKDLVSRAGVPVARGALAGRSDAGRIDALIADLGNSLVVKPNRQGSSVGLTFVDGAEALAARLAGAEDDGCIVEERIIGREVTVGVLDGRAMGVVEIRPKSGRFDYASKYTKGLTEYLAPAPLDQAVTTALKEHAETAFSVCGCRDFARVDFMVGEPGPVFLEVNTLPGLKETSLLPMSARCEGLDFNALVRRMIAPAIERQRASLSATASLR